MTTPTMTATEAIYYVNAEHEKWYRKFGNGRNKNDLRFGQAMCNALNITHGQIYNTEDASSALSLLISYLETRS